MAHNPLINIELFPQLQFTYTAVGKFVNSRLCNHVFSYTYTYIHTHTHITYIHTYIHTHITYIHIHTHTHTYI